MQDGSNLIWIIVAIGAILFIANLFILVWAMYDAESRGKSGCLVALLILILHIPGLIIWLLIRPEKKTGHHDQPKVP
jgi:uncharacterized membrane protein